MRSLRVICCIFFLLLVSSPVVFNIVFRLQTIAVRNEMKERLQEMERGQLVSLHLKTSDIRWYKKDKELQIGTELFDVKSIIATNDGYIVTGLFDKTEKELKTALEHLTNQHQQHNKKLVSFLHLVYDHPDEFSIGDLRYPDKERYPHYYSEKTSFNSSPVPLLRQSCHLSVKYPHTSSLNLNKANENILLIGAYCHVYSCISAG